MNGNSFFWTILFHKSALSTRPVPSAGRRSLFMGFSSGPEEHTPTLFGTPHLHSIYSTDPFIFLFPLQQTGIKLGHNLINRRIHYSCNFMSPHLGASFSFFTTLLSARFFLFSTVDFVRLKYSGFTDICLRIFVIVTVFTNFWGFFEVGDKLLQLEVSIAVGILNQDGYLMKDSNAFTEF